MTPLSPTDWKLIFDGRSISLELSIGHWSFPCRSHYWIKTNRVVWSCEWSDEEAAEARSQNAHARTAYYGDKNAGNSKAFGMQFERKNRKKKKNGLKSSILKWLGVETPPEAGPTE